MKSCQVYVTRLEKLRQVACGVRRVTSCELRVARCQLDKLLQKFNYLQMSCEHEADAKRSLLLLLLLLLLLPAASLG